MRFKVRIKLAASDYQKAVAFCQGCMKPLMTHGDVIYVTEKSDKKKYKTQYTMCADCLSDNSDEYERSA